MAAAISTAFAIYFVIWWIVLFAVLPWGVRSQNADEVQSGNDPGAPVHAALGKRLIWTTIVSAIVFAAFYPIYAYHLIPFDRVADFVWGPLRE